MDKEYSPETAPVSEESEMSSAPQRRARRVPQRFPNMTSAPTAEQTAGDAQKTECTSAEEMEIPTEVQTETIETEAETVSYADIIARAEDTCEMNSSEEDDFVPLVEMPTEQARMSDVQTEGTCT